MIEVVDATGSGDIDTSYEVEVANGVLLGLSGRTLHVGETWQNPSGKYRLGLKRGFDLFPKPLVQRLKDERKKKWDSRQHQLVTKLRKDLVLLGTPGAKTEEGKRAQDLEDQLAQLADMQKSYDDPGPVYGFGFSLPSFFLLDSCSNFSVPFFCRCCGLS